MDCLFWSPIQALVMLASFVAYTFCFYYAYSFGVIDEDIQTTFDITPVLADSVATAFHGLIFIPGIACGAFCRKFGAGLTIALGGFILSVGLFASFFVTRIYFLFVSLSLLGGDTEINESRSDSDDEAGGVIEEEEASQENDRVRNNNRIVVPGTRKRKRDSTDDLIAKVTREWQRDRDEYYNRQDQRDRLREEEERKRRDAEDGQMNQMMTLMSNTMMAIADSLRSLNTQNASYPNYFGR